MLENLRMKNPGMKIYSVDDAQFKSYGQIIDFIDTKEIVTVAQKIEMPDNGSLYVASEPLFEELSIAAEIENKCFGTLPTQIGNCFGHNSFLNGTEWHTSSEINIATTDLVLLLAKREQISDNKIDGCLFKAFFVPKGYIIEVYATTLHFCPCEVNSDGFGCVVALPTDTNTPLNFEVDDKLLFRKNKWLMAHVENKSLIERGAFPAITGENIKINY